MTWLLRDAENGEYFCLPHGQDKREWSTDIAFAHQFATEERARGGATVWFHLKGRVLVVDQHPDTRNGFQFIQ